MTAPTSSATFQPLPYPGPGLAHRPPAQLATASLVLGIVSLLLNIMLVPTILAIVFGVVSLASGTAARGRAIAGIVLGALGILVSIALAVVVFVGSLSGAGARVQLELVKDLEAQGGGQVIVECPAASLVSANTTMECTARTSKLGALRINVTFLDSEGHFTYRTEPIG